MPETSDDRAPAIRKPRWYAPTQAMFLLALLVAQGVLFLSAHYRWFWFNERKGWTVLVAVAATAVVLLLLGVFVIASRFFKSKAQFSLATLLLMVVVIAVPTGWLAREIDRARKQWELTTDQKNHDALYWKLTRIRAQKRQQLAMARVPRRLPFYAEVEAGLRPYLGEFFFHEVTEFTVYHSDALPRIHVLEDLKTLRCEPKLEVDLAQLRGLNRLQSLDLTDCRIVGDRLRPLGALPALETLRLNWTNITDEDLEALAQVKQLKHLGLDDTAVTDAGLKHVCQLSGLEKLWLARTNITNAGLQHVQGLKQLTVLDLMGTHISDDGLEHLKGLSQLEVLEIKGSGITADGQNQFQRALPRCLIVF